MKRWSHRLLDLFFRHEIINGMGRVSEYLHRWVLWRGRGGRAIYLHHFVGSDWSRDLHDHPKAFTSIGLKGRYAEVSPSRAPRVFKAPWFRRFPANHIHRLVLAPDETCWTLVYVGPLEREWGFWTIDDRGSVMTLGWTPWETYVRSAFADCRVAGMNSDREALRALDVWTGWD